MSDSGNSADSQAFYENRPTQSDICPGMELTPGLSGDEIAWQLIRLGMDAGRSGEEIARWLILLEDVPFWPDRKTIALLLWEAGL